MTATKWKAALAAALLVLVALPTAHAGNLELRPIILHNGSNTSAAIDTVEQQTPWFSVRGATQVLVRMWSANTSAWTAADSIYTDSLTTFKVLLSDSLCCTVTGPTGQTILSAADSVMFDMSVAASSPDTSSGAGVMAQPLPINKPLAAAKNGSGIVCRIYPAAMLRIGAAFVNPDGIAIFPKQFMRIRWQPNRRNTEGGRLSTTGKRTEGIRGFKMVAYPLYENK
jgi:hypothetical protein